jgi:polygalacturonase
MEAFSKDSMTIVAMSRLICRTAVAVCGLFLLNAVACASGPPAGCESVPRSEQPGPDEPAAKMRIVPAQIVAPPKPIFDPRTYGAKGDGKTYDTAALQKAIDACSGTGGSVCLSNGKFLSAQLTLKGRMTFYVAKDAVLLGGTRPEDYPVLLPGEPTDDAICRSLLYAAHADHLVLDGSGIIDGQGQHVKMFGKEPFRPSLVRIFFSKAVTVRNLTLNNPRMWTQVYLNCRDLTIDHITVNAPPKYCPNLDGMDIYDCSDAVVSNCRVNSDDDSICLKTRDNAGLHNITIENNEIRNTGANAIKIGTASRGQIADIQILNNTVYSADLGGLCIESVDGSAISNVTVRGLDLYHVSQPIFIRLAHRSGTPGSITNVKIENVRAIATSSSHAPSCTIAGIPSAHIGKIVIANSYFEMPGGLKMLPRTPPEKEDTYPQSSLFGNTPACGFYVRHADLVIFDQVSIGFYKPDVRRWLATEDATVQTFNCHDLHTIAMTGSPGEPDVNASP